MNDEKLRILKMIEERKISAEEGSKLMDALEPVQSGTANSDSDFSSGTQIRIKVSDMESGQTKVNLTIPIGIAHMIRSLVPKEEITKLENQGVNLNAIFKLVSTGKVGKILDIEDQEHKDRVEISVE